MRTLLIAAAAVLSLAPAVASGQTPVPAGEGTEGAILSLETQQEVDRRLLLSDRQRYQELLRNRRRASQDLLRLYQTLDDEYDRLLKEDISPEQAAELQQRLADLEQQVQQAETDWQIMSREAWLLRDRMRERGMRLALTRARTDALEASSVAQKGPLTGRWSVTLMPLNLSGTFELAQRGTLLTGNYQLGTERAGSFTGTVVGNRITMQQIDSQFGRDAVYYGTLSDDGQSIEGTWESLSLGTGRPAFGVWKGKRMPPEEKSEAEEPEPATTLPQTPARNLPR